MLISDLYQEIYSGITSNKVRSGLTMLGIIIGIGSVIAMLAIGTGAQNSIEESIQSIGSNLLIVRPGRGHGPGSQIASSRGSSQTLNFSDAEAISKLDLLKNVAPESSKNYQVVSGGNNTNTTVTGTISSYTEIKNLEIEKGIFFSDQHNLRISKVAVLGPNVVADLFPGEENVIGKKVRINGVEFSVVGTTVAKGGGGFGSSDDIIYIPLFSLDRKSTRLNSSH